MIYSHGFFPLRTFSCLEPLVLIFLKRISGGPFDFVLTVLALGLYHHLSTLPVAGTTHQLSHQLLMASIKSA
jgi:hypothetical protein